MKAFAALVDELEGAASARTRLEALCAYLRGAVAADAAWAVCLLAGARRKAIVPWTVLSEQARAASGLPPWLLEACHDAVGERLETLALVLPEPTAAEQWPLHRWLQALRSMRGLARDALPSALQTLWTQLPADQRPLVFRLLAGRLRPVLSRTEVAQALADLSGVDALCVAQRIDAVLHAEAEPTEDDWTAWLHPGPEPQDLRPWPFAPCEPLQVGSGSPGQLQTRLGDARSWQVRWLREGRRVQLVRRGGAAALWSEDQELISAACPQIIDAAGALPPGTRIEGLLQAEIPVLWVQDVREAAGRDVRGLPWKERDALLTPWLAASGPALQRADGLPGGTWEAFDVLRSRARAERAMGLQLQHRDDPQAAVLDWPQEAMRVNAVLIYAHRPEGGGGRPGAGYTFAVWSAPPDASERQLLPLAKVHEGLDAATRAPHRGECARDHAGAFRAGHAGDAPPWSSNWASRASCPMRAARAGSSCAGPGCCAGGPT